MRPETLASLSDAKSAALEIREIGSDAFQNSRIHALAVERLFKIVGEALVRIRESEPGLLALITDAHAIIGLRNVIAHGYDAVDPKRMKVAIGARIPVLIQEISSLLDRTS